METINWKIEGMTCATCVLTVHKYLEKAGAQNVRVSLASGDVSFDTGIPFDDRGVRKGMEALGYTVLKAPEAGVPEEKKPMNKHLRYLLICLPFTAVLLLHMFSGILPLHWLMNPWVQLGICLPVYVAGMHFFGRSAVKSLLNRIPNMNVLIAAGASAAFLYSLVGTLFGLGPDYLFYETAASIITLVFLGYYLEDISVRATQRALSGLVRSQKTMANMIAYDDQHQEQNFPVENTQLRSGDLLLIRTGEQVPADCKILWGEAGVDESIITGESLPVERKPKDILIGGSILVAGTVKTQVTAAGGDSVLSGIINLVRQAQGEKPPGQQLADRISAVFVPLVLGISLLTILLNYWYLHAVTPALMRGIAVLVIACPCAMGLATPAAIAVGLGRAARQGILFRHAAGLESFKDIRRVVFDKTGTLTTGAFSIRQWKMMESAVGGAGITEEAFKQITFSLEKYSAHPLAQCVAREWKQKNEIRWAKVEEVRGLGMRGEAKTGEVYWAGSFKLFAQLSIGQPDGELHNIYIIRERELLGWIDVADTVRPEAAAVVRWLHDKGMKTLLLSGDRLAACLELAASLGIQDVLAEQSPEDKMQTITRLSQEMPTAMVGDGINDAPALARATIGISMSDASQLAMQTADVVLMNHGLKQLPAAMELGRSTYTTIRQNLFWAFFYNLVAIPVAALGGLTPALAALVMGCSDVLLVFNSVRLFVKKLTVIGNAGPLKGVHT